MEYINHGTLIDTIDYAKLIASQANNTISSVPSKVIGSRKKGIKVRHNTIVRARSKKRGL